MPALQIYRTYSFKTKDPIIDRLRTIKKDEKYTDAEISERSGVSTTTLYNWFQGATRRPQHATIMAVARCMGYDYELVKKSGAGNTSRLK
jgi:transcriptional regulator with XRE-family HTH domain